MQLNTLMIIASLTAPICIISFVRRGVVSVPLGVIVFVVFMTAVPDLTISIWERLCTNLFYGFFYVWFWYSCRKLSLWQSRARGNPPNQRQPVVWRWALLCAWTCNATLLVISIVQACRGYPYPNEEAFPFRVSFIEDTLAGSTLFLFIASPLLFERCGTLAFLSWMTIVGLFFWGLLCPQF